MNLKNPRLSKRTQKPNTEYIGLCNSIFVRPKNVQLIYGNSNWKMPKCRIGRVDW